MKARLKKYAKRLVIVLLALGVIGLIGFSWFCYWPFEGDVDDLMKLVPYKVEFVARMDFDGLLETGWPRENFEEDPIHPALHDWVHGTGEFRKPQNQSSALPAIKERMAELEQQINASIPVDFDWATFGIEKDVLTGETVVAGRWCAGFGPSQGPPSWQELLLLTRVSWRTKCIAALKHEFVREQVSADRTAPLIEAMDDDVFKLTFRDVRVSPVANRSGCGRDFVMPPENVWYLHRVKDVIALSNSELLITQVAELGKDDSAEDSFASRPGFDTKLDRSGFVAASDLTPLQSYLVKAMERNPRARILGRYLRPRSIEKFNGGLEFSSPDLLRGGADISFVAREAGEVVEKVYGLTPRPVSEGIAELVPAEDTFAVLFLRSDPFFLMKGIYEDALTLKERAMWNDNLRQMKDHNYETVDDFFLELSDFMGDTSTVAISRLSEIYNQYKYDSFYADEPDPMQGIAIMLRVRHGKTFEEINEFLTEKVPFLGLDIVEQVDYRGFKYTLLKPRAKDMDLKHLDPAYVLVQDHLIFANNYTYLRQIIDTIADKGQGSLKDDPTFRETMAALPAQGHVAAFLDVEKLSRIPRDSNPSSTPRGFLWDMRMAVIRDDSAHDSNILGPKFREEAGKKYRRPHSEEDKEKIEEEVSERMDAHYANYPSFAETYRRDLEGMRRFRGIGFVLNAAGAEIDAQFALTLREAEDWLTWRQR